MFVRAAPRRIYIAVRPPTWGPGQIVAGLRGACREPKREFDEGFLGLLLLGDFAGARGDVRPSCSLPRASR
ncbi:MAG: hypothetical protein ACP5I3_06745 [Thermoproteus sp.]